jgi:hypothetical protein
MPEGPGRLHTLILQLQLGGQSQGQSLLIKEWITIQITRHLQALTGPLEVPLLSYGFLLGVGLTFLTAADDASLCLRAGLLIPFPRRSCTPTAHPSYPSTQLN